MDTVKTAQTDRTLSVYALPQEDRFNIPCNFRIAKTNNAPEKVYSVDGVDRARRLYKIELVNRITGI